MESLELQLYSMCRGPCFCTPKTPSEVLPTRHVYWPKVPFTPGTTKMQAALEAAKESSMPRGRETTVSGILVSGCAFKGLMRPLCSCMLYFCRGYGL